MKMETIRSNKQYDFASLQSRLSFVHCHRNSTIFVMVDGSSFGTQLNGTIYASSDAASGRRPPHHRNHSL